MGNSFGDADPSPINIAGTRTYEDALAALQYSLLPDLRLESSRMRLENLVAIARHTAQEEASEEEKKRESAAQLVMNFRADQARQLSEEDTQRFNSFIEKKVFGAQDVDDLEEFLQRNKNNLDISQKIQLSSPLLFRSTTEAQKRIQWDGETGETCTKALNLLGGVKALCQEKDKSKLMQWLSNDVSSDWDKVERSKRDALAQAFKDGNQEKALEIASTLPKELQEKIIKRAQESGKELILWNNPELMKKTFDNIREEIKKDPQILENNPDVFKKLNELEKKLSSPDNKDSDRKKAEALQEFAEENNLKINKLKLKQDAVECTNNQARTFRDKNKEKSTHKEKDFTKEEKFAELAEQLKDKITLDSQQFSSKPNELQKQAQEQSIGRT